MISQIILGISLACIVFGALLGLIRGRNRSILRFIIIIACAVASFVLMGKITSLVLSFEIQGGVTIKESLFAMFGDVSEIPETLINLVFALIEIIVGLVIFLVAFILLELLSWIIVYPILKIIVRPGAKKHRFTGMVVGLLQGVLVAFVLCAPLNGLASEASKLANLEINGQKLPIPEFIQLTGYEETPTYKFYDSTCGWFYELLTSKETETGTNVSISDTIDVVVAAKDVVEESTNLTSNLDKVSNSETTVQEKVDSLKNVGDNLINIGTTIDNLSNGGKEILKEVITNVVSSFVGDGEEVEGEEESGPTVPPAIQEVIENIDFDDFSIASTGEAIKGISSYIEKTDESFDSYGEEVTQEEVDMIINGVQDNAFIINLIVGNVEEVEEIPTLIEVREEDADKFESALSQADKLSEDQKEMLKKLLGLN